MEALKADLEFLSKQTKLLPAERTIAEKLINFESILKENITEFDFNEIVPKLIKILDINNFTLSFQCSVRIGTCVVHALRRCPSKNAEEIISILKDDPTSQKTYALGVVILSIKHNKKYALTNIVKDLLNYSERFQESTLFALICCFKSLDKTLVEHIFAAQKFAEYALGTEREPTQLFAIKLLSKLRKYHKIPSQTLIDIFKLHLTRNPSPFVVEAICSQIARIAYEMINSDNEIETLKMALEVVYSFEGNFNAIFSLFFPMLNNDLLQRQNEIMLDFISTKARAYMTAFTDLLSKETRKKMFKKYEKEPLSRDVNLRILEQLDYDADSKSSIATLAHDLAASEISELRDEGANYFCTLYQRNRALAIRFLRSTLLFLGETPEQFPKRNRNIKAKALIASNIISSHDFKEDILRESEANIDKFIRRALSVDDILKGEFGAAFVLMSALPSRLISMPIVSAGLSRFVHFFSKNTITERIEANARYCGNAVAVYLAAHPDTPKAFKALSVLLGNVTLSTPVAKLGAYIAFQHAEAPFEQTKLIFTRLHADIAALEPSKDYMQFRIRAPMISQAELLHGAVFSMPKYPSAFLRLSFEDFVVRIVEGYPEYIAHIPAGSIDSEISFLWTGTNLDGQALLMHALIRSDKTFGLFPTSIVEYLLGQCERITTETIARGQLFAECLAHLAKRNANIGAEILKRTSTWRSIGKCLVYAAFFSVMQVEESTMVSIILELNALAKEKELTPYAMFALSTLLQTSFQALASMQFTNDQCVYILSALHSSVAMEPFALFYTTNCLIALLPVISPELASARSDIVPILKCILQALQDTKVPFAKQIFYMTMRSANQFAPSLTSSVHLKFINSKSASLACRLNCCGLFSDIINIAGAPEDFFEFVPETLALLQVTKEERASDFVTAIAHSFAQRADTENKATVERLGEWTSLTRSVLVTGEIPTRDGRIDAREPAKRCMLKVAKALVPLIKRVNLPDRPFASEVVFSALAPINNSEQSLMEFAYAVMTAILEQIPAGFENELAIAAERGFGFIDQCGAFHTKLLNLFCKRFVDGDPEFDPIFRRVVAGIDRITTVPNSFIPIADILLDVAQQSEAAKEIMRPYLKQLNVVLARKVEEIIEAMDKAPISVGPIALLFSCWGRFLRSFVWLERETEELILPGFFVSFCCDELRRCREPWRLKAAFDCLCYILRNTTMWRDDVTEAIESMAEVADRLPFKVDPFVDAVLPLCDEAQKLHVDALRRQIGI